ncbi:hypothetical protein ACF08W_29610 [Streptomyces sp. NPDC015144]|uniref:hypothetical protein n=1 Tax=Streptomyces sp. NPDC015144 TaxID=3364944 RepID=UPI0037023753
MTLEAPGPVAPEAPEVTDAAETAESDDSTTASEAAVSPDEDLDAYYARFGLIRRWRNLPEPVLAPPAPESATEHPKLEEDDLIAYAGPGNGIRDSSYFYFGTEQVGGRLLAGRLFIDTTTSRLSPGDIVRTWGHGSDGQWPRTPYRGEALQAARAVEARNEAALGNMELVERFMASDLGLWRGARWQEPVATALMGEWASTLYTHGTIRRGALDQLMRDVREIHRQLTPLWRRRCAGERLLSLDAPVLDSGLTLGDLIASGPDPADALGGTLPDDPRVLSVLNQLSPLERAVALAWSRPRTTSWTEAAADILALDALASPGHRKYAGLDAQALGERVRRKLKRLGGRHTARHASARAQIQRPDGVAPGEAALSDGNAFPQADPLGGPSAGRSGQAEQSEA